MSKTTRCEFCTKEMLYEDNQIGISTDCPFCGMMFQIRPQAESELYVSSEKMLRICRTATAFPGFRLALKVLLWLGIIVSVAVSCFLIQDMWDMLGRAALIWLLYGVGGIVGSVFWYWVFTLGLDLLDAILTHARLCIYRKKETGGEPLRR